MSAVLGVTGMTRTRWLLVYRLAVAAIALTILLGLGDFSAFAHSDLLITLAVFAPLQHYLDRRAFTVAGGRLSLGATLQMTTLLLWGPEASAALTCTWLLLPFPWDRKVFTVGMYILSQRAAWIPLQQVDLSHLTLPGVVLLGAGMLAYWFVNMSIVSGNRLIPNPIRLVDFLRDHVLSILEEYFFNLILAVMIALAYVHAGWAGALVSGVMMISRFRAMQKAIVLREQNELSIQSLIAAIEAKDPFTRGHSDRVAALARRLAQTVGLRPNQITLVWNAARLHDIGKIGVPDGILTKGSSLTDAEYRQVQEHARIGEHILGSREDWHDLAQIVGQHHEWYNGQGYPRGLSGNGIQLEARIIGLVDAYDAMTSTRSYRAARSPAAALREIEAYSGRQFDPALAQALIAMLRAELKGAEATDKVDVAG